MGFRFGRDVRGRVGMFMYVCGRARMCSRARVEAPLREAGRQLARSVQAQ